MREIQETKPLKKVGGEPIAPHKEQSYYNEDGLGPEDLKRLEKESFLERLSKYEEKEEEEKTLRKEIEETPDEYTFVEGQKSKKDVPFLEKEEPEEKKQKKFLENLRYKLKALDKEDADPKKIDELLETDIDFLNKIKTLLNTFKAENIKDITDRENIYTELYDTLKSMENQEIRKAFEEVSEMEIPQGEKQKILSEKMTEITRKFSLEELFEYLNLKESKKIELE